MTDQDLTTIADTVNVQRVEIELMRATGWILKKLATCFAEDTAVGKPTWLLNGQGQRAIDLSVTISIPVGDETVTRVIESVDAITLPSFLEETVDDLESEIIHRLRVWSHRRRGTV